MAANMTDKEYMEDILLTTKTLSELYHVATQESSSEQIHSQFKTNLNNALNMQNSVFKSMQQNGWYQQQQAEPKQISQVKSKFSKSGS